MHTYILLCWTLTLKTAVALVLHYFSLCFVVYWFFVFYVSVKSTEYKYRAICVYYVCSESECYQLIKNSGWLAVAHLLLSFVFSLVCLLIYRYDYSTHSFCLKLTFASSAGTLWMACISCCCVFDNVVVSIQPSSLQVDLALDTHTKTHRSLYDDSVFFITCPCARLLLLRYMCA